MAHESEAPIRARQQLFARAAAALANDLRLVAPCLAAYRSVHRLDEDELADWLGLASVEALHGLALCRRPVPAVVDIDTAVAALASYIGCDATRLRILVTLDTDQSPD